MPAAAVIPAPIAYIQVVAVEKLVVGFGFLCCYVHFGRDSVWTMFLPGRCCSVLNWVG